MITLKTLPQSTAQQVFEQVASHLLTQMKKSEGSNYCLYRSPEGLKCAAGCLIADDEYFSNMDDNHGVSWSTFVARNYVPAKHESLITRLQNIHDIYEPRDWLRELRRAADHFELDDNILKKFSPEYE